jgi:hypothetical protein
MLKANIKINQQSIPYAHISNSHGQHVCKVDLVFPAVELKAQVIKSELNPVKNLDDHTVGFDAEIEIGTAIVALDEISQLDDIITALQEIGAQSIKFGPIVVDLMDCIDNPISPRCALLEQLSDLRDLWAEKIKQAYSVKR